MGLSHGPVAYGFVKVLPNSSHGGGKQSKERTWFHPVAGFMLVLPFLCLLAMLFRFCLKENMLYFLHFDLQYFGFSLGDVWQWHLWNLLTLNLLSKTMSMTMTMTLSVRYVINLIYQINLSDQVSQAMWFSLGTSLFKESGPLPHASWNI